MGTGTLLTIGNPSNLQFTVVIPPVAEIDVYEGVKENVNIDISVTCELFKSVKNYGDVNVPIILAMSP